MSQRTMAARWVLGLAAIVLVQSSIADAVPATPRPIVLKAARLFDSVHPVFVMKEGTIYVGDPGARAGR